MAAEHVAPEALRVVLADAHPVIRSGLRAVLQAIPDVAVAAEAESFGDTVRAVLMYRPDVVVLDLDLGRRTVTEILRSAPHTRVLVFTMTDEDESVVAALQAGALGYVLKDAPHDSILRAIRGVAAGEAVLGPTVARRLSSLVGCVVPDAGRLSGLTGREHDVLALVAEGLANSAIAQRLGLAPKTISNHLSSIFAKLGVSSRAEAAVRARREGLR
ncbi:LuxR C-terminal-related transcriptional regulator [Kribbella sp. NPDC058245]|uniref:LuxR C-terminal-related transcriptional regulator n=1 Tax=Kribbella sp. NPDC058245 TaxID=3346399 RepID=UPI0036EE0016